MKGEINIFKNNPFNDNKVAMCDKSRASDILPKMLSKAGFEPKEYGLVLVKPNLCGMYHPQPRLIEYTLRYFEPLAQRIVIGETDSMGHTPEKQFRQLGVTDMLKRFGSKVEAVNLMKDEILDLEVPSPHTVNRLPIPKLVHDCDLLVNIPKVGTHSRTMLTCAFKNLFGLLAEKNKYGSFHPLSVDRVIADLAKIVRCDINIVDARENVIVGLNPLPVDILACGFVDLDPLRVEHLRLISEDRNLRLDKVMKQIQIIRM
jgi:uncharacterized protein (DUF362 family)